MGTVFAMEAQKHVRYDHEVPGKLARRSMVQFDQFLTKENRTKIMQWLPREIYRYHVPFFWAGCECIHISSSMTIVFIFQSLFNNHFVIFARFSACLHPSNSKVFFLFFFPGWIILVFLNLSLKTTNIPFFFVKMLVVKRL